MDAGLLLDLLWSFLLRVVQVVLCADASCCPYCAQEMSGLGSVALSGQSVKK